MRDPLLLPVTAVISGILLGHWSEFSVHEAAWPTAAFLLLAFPARSTWLRQVCIGLALVCTGLLAEAWHRPGPPPEIDAGYKETVLLDGCVVDPTVFSPGREQFTLELAPAARARVSLALDDPNTMQKLDYGQRVEIEARVRSPAQLQQSRSLRLHRLPGAPEHFLDRDHDARHRRRACCRDAAGRDSWPSSTACARRRLKGSTGSTQATTIPPA